MIFYFHYFGHVREMGCKVYCVALWFLFAYKKTKHPKLQNMSLDNLGTVLLQKKTKLLKYYYMTFCGHIPSTIYVCFSMIPWHHTSLFKYYFILC